VTFYVGGFKALNYYEKTENQVTVYSGRIINVKNLDVSLPNGKMTKREVVEHPGAVAILAKTNDNKLVLIKQFRKAVEEVLWEIPAGKLEKGEKPLISAQRELEEETGYKAETWYDLGKFYTTPGFSNEIIYLFGAENLIKGPTNLDIDEYVEVYPLSVEEIDELINKGQIYDAKTLIAILKYKLKER